MAQEPNWNPKTEPFEPFLQERRPEPELLLKSRNWNWTLAMLLKLQVKHKEKPLELKINLHWSRHDAFHVHMFG